MALKNQEVTGMAGKAVVGQVDGPKRVAKWPAHTHSINQALFASPLKGPSLM